MVHPALIVAATFFALVVIKLLVVLLISRGSMKRISLARRAGWRLLRDCEFAEQVEPLLQQSTESEGLDAAPIRLLAVLQREGRLLDFLLEEIAGASDEQIAAGVREIHRDCQKALREHIDLEPIFTQQEGELVEVRAGFDPSAIQLTGNVTGEPPFKGNLQHAGWRVKDIRLAKPAEGVDELVIQPAEIELP